MRNLPPAIIGAYTNRASAEKVGVGFDSLKQIHGASAPISLGAFFAPEGFPFGGIRWEAFGLAGGVRDHRSVNPSYAATTIFSSVGCRRLVHVTVGFLIMPILIVRRAATLKELAEHARIHSAQTCALAETIHTLAGDKDEFQDSKHFIPVTSLIWLLLSLLEQQEAMCERIESLVFEGDAA
jgi:hypothetical protein